MKRMNFLHRLALLLDDRESCWLWDGAINKDGYGRANRSEGGVQRNLLAHREAYTLLIGPIPRGIVLYHLCGVRRCFNPWHLEPITHAEAIYRGRGNGGQTHCAQGHEFTPENTRICHHHRGEKVYAFRSCRICHRENGRKLRARQSQALRERRKRKKEP